MTLIKSAVLHHICSDFGKSSSIGFRSEKICKLEDININIQVICRSYKSFKKKPNNIYTLNLVFLISRFLAFIKAFIFYNFPLRDFELSIFNFLSVPIIIFHFLKNQKAKRYFHSWDSSFWVLILVKKLNYTIIKDCAMTPSKISLIKTKQTPSFYFDKTTSNKRILLEKSILDISETIISPSQFTTYFITKEYDIAPEKIKTIPFGVDIEKYSSLKNKKEIKNYYIKFGFVGLVNMRKGIRWLINDLNIFYEKENKNFELHIFGRIFKEEIKFLNKAKFKVIKYGYVDVFKNDIYNLFDILIHPSFIEGSAKCIYEGMASSLPIICTEESGSIVKHKTNGFIIKAGDSNALISAIKFFFNNKNQIISMGEKSLKIVKKYTWKRYAKKVVANYLI